MGFRAGDVIHHAPSGEEWLLACDEERGEVICCGWPETIAKATDCTLVTAATDEERAALLARVAKSCAGQLRGSRAAQQPAPSPSGKGGADDAR